MLIILLTRSLINEGKVKMLRVSMSQLLLNVTCLWNAQFILEFDQSNDCWGPLLLFACYITCMLDQGHPLNYLYLFRVPGVDRVWTRSRMAKYACDPRATPPSLMLRQNFYGFPFLLISLFLYNKTVRRQEHCIKCQGRQGKEPNSDFYFKLFSSALQKQIGFCCHDICKMFLFSI